MPVTFERINAREYRHRCFVFAQLQALAKSKAGSSVAGLKKAVDGGFSRVPNPPAGDPRMLFVIAHRMDTSGDSRKVRYTTLFSLAAKFYIFQADPAANESYAIVMCAKLTMQQFANFVASFARDAEERFGYADARQAEDAPGVTASTDTYASTPQGVGGHTGFAQVVGQVHGGAAEEIYVV